MNFTAEHYWFLGTVIVLNVLLFIVPAALIVRRTGHSGWWMLLCLIPGGMPVGMWILALGRWPALEKHERENTNLPN